MSRSQIIRRTAWWLLASGFCVVFIGGVTAWRVADKLTAARPFAVGEPPTDFPAQSISIHSGSGDTLAGWYQRGEPGRGVVVVAHGIRGNRRGSLERAKLIAEAGFSTLVFDLRCHGESTGRRITLGKLESLDIVAAVGLAQRMNPDEPVGVVGFSLGGAAAALALPLDVDAVVLEAVFPTIDKAILNRTRQRLGPFAAIGTWALRAQLAPRLGVSADELRPIEAVGKAGRPLLIVGGKKDIQTTPADTLALFSAAMEPKELVWFEELGHSNYARWQPERYRATVVDFLQRSMRP